MVYEYHNRQAARGKPLGGFFDEGIASANPGSAGFKCACTSPLQAAHTRHPADPPSAVMMDSKQAYEARRDALPWRRWYKTQRWQNLRAAHLRAHPVCAMCKQRGFDTPATVCNHIKRHDGDESLFWSGPFNSLCKQCHDSDQQRIEDGNQPRSFADANGWPRDPRHPWFDRGATR